LNKYDNFLVDEAEGSCEAKLLISQLNSSHELYEKWKKLPTIYNAQELANYSDQQNALLENAEKPNSSNQSVIQELNKQQSVIDHKSKPPSEQQISEISPQQHQPQITTSFSTGSFGAITVDTGEMKSSRSSKSESNIARRDGKLLQEPPKQQMITEIEKNSAVVYSLRPDESTSTRIKEVHLIEKPIVGKHSELRSSSQEVPSRLPQSPRGILKTSKKDKTEMSKSITELTDTMHKDKAVQMEFTSLGEPLEFMKCIEKLISSTQTVDKHLDNIQKINKEFLDFEKQDLKLNAIKQTLESLALALKTSLSHKQEIIDKSNKEISKKISKAMSSLVKQHQEVVKKYKEKNAIYVKNNDKWLEFDKDYQTIKTWLEQTLIKVNELKQSDLSTNRVQDVIRVTKKQ
jgi:hypothetical protein